MRERDVEWARLMRAANAGDRAAYARLLRELAHALRPAALRGLARARRPVCDAEDIVQDILLAVHVKRHTWDPQRPIGPWIRAIAQHKLVDALRRRGGEALAVPLEDILDVVPAEAEPPSASPREAERVLATLPPRQRQVVQAIAVEGASIQQAAQRFAMTETAVRVALHRGLSALARTSGALSP